ncbi:MAG: TRAP transporter substrate-binding protein [Alphaproteobacteria bacterium]|nr:MAG: TRAP transporter substrate-binding protein [Alphaproteobacteria bacterium]
MGMMKHMIAPALAATLAFAGQAMAPINAVAAEITWISGGLGSPNSDEGKSAEKFADMVTERSNGRIKIEMHGGGQLGTGQEQMEAVSTGTQQMFISAGSQASRLVKAFGVIDTAFLFKDFGHMERFMESDMGQQLNQKLVDEYGVRIIASNWFALPRYLMHRDKFIESLGDVKGVRVRTASVPMYVQNYENMGAVPVKIAYGEQYLALSQGVVDMTESAANRILPTKLYEVAPYITEADMMFPQVSVFVNEEAWKKLSPEDQKLIADAAHEAGVYQTKLSQKTFATQKKEIMSKGGKFERMPEALRDKFADNTKLHLQEMVKKGLIPDGWYEKITALRNQ